MPSLTSSSSMAAKSHAPAIGNKQQLLMQSLTNFFTRGSSILHFLDSTKPDSSISLRVIDWFVTNFSREFDVSYCHPETQMPFLVHDAYKSQLKAYSKRQFDPFCRRTRINFYYKKGSKVVTTVGQLNFFRWAIGAGVLAYIQKHQDAIEAHMKTRVKKSRENKKKTCKSSSSSGSKSPAPSKVGGQPDDHYSTTSGGPSGDNRKHVNGGAKDGGGGKTKRKPSAAAQARRTISKHNVAMTVYFQ